MLRPPEHFSTPPPQFKISNQLRKNTVRLFVCRNAAESERNNNYVSNNELL